MHVVRAKNDPRDAAVRSGCSWCLLTRGGLSTAAHLLGLTFRVGDCRKATLRRQRGNTACRGSSPVLGSDLPTRVPLLSNPASARSPRMTQGIRFSPQNCDQRPLVRPRQECRNGLHAAASADEIDGVETAASERTRPSQRQPCRCRRHCSDVRKGRSRRLSFWTARGCWK